MVETTANHKRLVGNVCLHRALAPERRFLRRNLRHILDSHESILRRATGARDIAEAHEGMVANERTSAGWNYPTTEMLECLMKGQKPLLSVEGLRIQHPKSKAATVRRSERRMGVTDGLEWLPSTDVGFSLPCNVVFNIVNSEAGSERRGIYHETRSATINGKKENGVSDFDIELDQPLSIPVEKLFTVKETGKKPYRWKRTVTTKYDLKVMIRCQDSEDTADLLYQLEGNDAAGRNRDSYAGTTAGAGTLTAVWEKLPECPPPGHTISLVRPKEGKVGQASSLKPLSSGYQLQLAMGWTERKGTVLERYNRKRETVSRTSRQLPTPTASDDLEKEPQRCEVVYKYQDGLYTRTKTVEGLTCPLCPGAPVQPSMSRLRLHCATYHDHFKFEMEDAGLSARAMGRYTVWISLGAEDSTEKVRNAADPAEQMNWTAPHRPFDVDAQLDGEDDWMGTRPKRKTGRRKGAKAKINGASAHGTPQPVRKRPAPEEVEDLPDMRPAKRRVPNVPGVRFYHTTSKQVIEPGSLVSDSDEDIDESWHKEKTSHVLEEAGITGAARDFSLLWDAHMEREQPESSLFVREALVRFTRQRRQKLQDPEWQRLFKEKLLLLHEHNIIGHETFSYCLEQTNGGHRAPTSHHETPATAGAAPDPQMGNGRDGTPGLNGHATGRERKRWVNGKFVSFDGDRSVTPSVNGEQAREPLTNGTAKAKGKAPSIATQSTASAKVKGLCFCGQSASWQMGSIACADLGCVQKDFHLACVGLEQRVHGWRCPDCA
ncbi:uncharacterized protein LTR77_002665 [Saxophila tyrrhenica]|uniref:Polycomb protein VEFS-Box domain-containing protein n=1 Tax=Saxophila tyrrhenica TaxID=1690608 RepID=A0AAV9PJQ2_9PEZI|nr:hypothetical protein LTR77_002665 [Saxophila tyrrhenica]